MTTFDERERAHETKFAHDEHTAFRVRAKRDRLFGLWAAEKLGKSGEAADAYAKSILDLDLEKHGIHAALKKVAADLAAADVHLSDSALTAQLEKLEATAKKELA